MYEAFYGFEERPFDLTPNPRFLHMTAGHREALSTIQYGIAGRKGLTLLVGPAGTGKTTLVHAALARQEAQKAKSIHLSNPTLTRDEFYEWLSFELGLSKEAARSKTQFLRELGSTLHDPFMAMSFMALEVIPALKLTDEGLVDVETFQHVDLFV